MASPRHFSCRECQVSSLSLPDAVNGYISVLSALSRVCGLSARDLFEFYADPLNSIDTAHAAVLPSLVARMLEEPAFHAELEAQAQALPGRTADVARLLLSAAEREQDPYELMKSSSVALWTAWTLAKQQPALFQHRPCRWTAHTQSTAGSYLFTPVREPQLKRLTLLPGGGPEHTGPPLQEGLALNPVGTEGGAHANTTLQDLD